MKEDKRILVIGDVMIDIYIQGTANRLSPEAPCVVLNNCKPPVYKLGGASNVAYQLSENNHVSLCGGIGNDFLSRELLELTQKENINVDYLVKEDVNTTTKTRYLSESNHQLLRVDDDSIFTIDERVISQLCFDISNSCYDVVVLSDYNKGVLTDSLCNAIIDCCNKANIPTIVDIKCAPYNKFQCATLIKGNEKEITNLALSLGIAETNPTEILTNIATLLKCKYVVMTKGKNGIAGYSKSDGYIEIPGTDIPIHDVTGAGDVVTSCLALLIANNVKFEEMLRLSNKAAQCKVSQLGTSRVSFRKISSNSPKLKDDITEIINNRDCKTIVFTNGCFDVLHAGHIDLLNKAKQYGDVLVVGLNSDSSISINKGTNRPVNTFENRAAVLSALECVDYIVEFDEPTPYNLISILQPDVLVKGGDYTIDSIVGSDIVSNNGGKVIIVPITIPTSSTNILKQLSYE